MAYKGNKAIDGVYHSIINEIPLCDIFIEGFAGGAGISRKFNMPPGKIILNDLNRSGIADLIYTGSSYAYSNLDILDLLSMHSGSDEKKVMFLDPPYLWSTRPYSLKLYEHEMSDIDHKKFLNAILQYSGKVLLIHPKCTLYDDALKDWRQKEISIRYHNKTSREILYMNFSMVDQLQDDSYLGVNFWDRQRIQRRTAGIVAKFKSMPAAERNYILKRLNNTF